MFENKNMFVLFVWNWSSWDFMQVELQPCATCHLSSNGRFLSFLLKSSGGREQKIESWLGLCLLVNTQQYKNLLLPKKKNCPTLSPRRFIFPSWDLIILDYTIGKSGGVKWLDYSIEPLLQWLGDDMIQTMVSELLTQTRYNARSRTAVRHGRNMILPTRTAGSAQCCCSYIQRHGGVCGEFRVVIWCL